jgi:ornithine cyclodeaminase
MSEAEVGLDPRLPLRYLSPADVAARIELASVVDAVRDAFVAGTGDADDQPQRLSLGGGRLLVMATRDRADHDSVVKVLRVDTDRGGAPKHRQTIDGILMWLGAAGEPILAIDAGSVTALRTAAMVALATDLLAPITAHRLAILGAGRQALEQGPAVALVRPLTDIVVWNRTRRHAEALASHLVTAMPDVTVRVADRADDAVGQADVVCCATAATEPLFTASALGVEAHVNAIGSYRADMHEVPRDLLVRASVVAVDNAAACLIEAGEIVAAVRAGVLDAQGLDELSHLLVRPPPRHGTTVFKSVGVALADLAVARLLAARL